MPDLLFVLLCILGASIAIMILIFWIVWMMGHAPEEETTEDNENNDII